jgi:hypothetical protein
VQQCVEHRDLRFREKLPLSLFDRQHKAPALLGQDSRPTWLEAQFASNNQFSKESVRSPSVVILGTNQAAALAPRTYRWLASSLAETLDGNSAF